MFKNKNKSKEMKRAEIMKVLYKNKPEANFEFIKNGVAYYSTLVDGLEINFEIPTEDMGDADFFPTMEAKHLNRWISENTEKEKYEKSEETNFKFIRKNVAYYSTNELEISFEIPVEDIGGDAFFPTMEAKYLNRWVVSDDE